MTHIAAVVATVWLFIDGIDRLRGTWTGATVDGLEIGGIYYGYDYLPGWWWFVYVPLSLAYVIMPLVGNHTVRQVTLCTSTVVGLVLNAILTREMPIPVVFVFPFALMTALVPPYFRDARTPSSPPEAEFAAPAHASGQPTPGESSASGA